jgi:uncharacterized membrane protein YraQ (UPF0718 family)
MIISILKEIWLMTAQAAPYLLFGFMLAGLIRAFINEDQIREKLGGKGFGSILRASLFGVPLPLCSCGVMPVAASLRKSGASRGATTSFLISTPESGIDSMAITYALLGLPLTIIRPLAAFGTALFAGIFTNAVDKADDSVYDTISVKKEDSNCGCCQEQAPQGSLIKRMSEGIYYSFTDLLPSISLYLVQGLILAGLISFYLPSQWVQNHMDGGPWAMLIMLAAGIPLYICATSSTPIAAAFIAKGMSPGTALVFLLAGLATNIATMVLVNKILGKKFLAIYLASIAVCAILFGLTTDWAYTWLDLDIKSTTSYSDHSTRVTWFSGLCGALLGIFMGYGIWVENGRKWLRTFTSRS